MLVESDKIFFNIKEGHICVIRKFYNNIVFKVQIQFLFSLSMVRVNLYKSL